jgi:NADPH:quinone reductase-like Zn-dependent oxidoreductase
MTMRAMALKAHGGLDRLELMDLPRPDPGPGQVLIRVKACALNHLDLFVREGWPGLDLGMPHILGSDISGVVERWGEGVEGLKAGQPVVINPGLSDRTCEYCRRGEDSLCVDYKIVGEHIPGGYAEFVAVPADNVIPIPAGQAFEEVAAVPLVFMTAWRMLIHRAKLKPAEDVLVVGIGGGVSSAAIQVAKVAGARVFAVSRSEQKLKRAEELGAEILIDSSRGDFSEEVWKQTNKRGVDVVVENVGEATWKQSVRSLALGGRLVTCGATTGPRGEVDIRRLFWRQLSLIGSTMGSHTDLTDVLKLVWSGRLRPVVDSIFPLEEAREAQKRLEAAEQFGKIVLRV